VLDPFSGSGDASIAIRPGEVSSAVGSLGTSGTTFEQGLQVPPVDAIGYVFVASCDTEEIR
jgi:hypothetical protein